MANALPQGTSQQQQFSKPNPRMGHGLTQVPQAQNFQALNLPQQPQFVRFAVNGITAQLPYAGSVIHVVQPQAIAGTSLLQQLNTSVEAKQGPVSAPVPAGNLPTVVQELTVPGPSLASNNAAAASPIVMVSSAPHVQQTTVAFPSSTSTPITRSVLVGKDLANPNGSSLHHGSGHPSALSFTAPAPPRSLEPPIVKRAMGKDNDTTQRSGTILSGNASALPLLTSYLTTPETASNSRRKQHLEMRRVEDATMEVVEKMDVNAESELSIKVLDACSIPLQIFDSLGDPNTEAGIDPGWNEEQIRPMEEPTDVGGTTGTAVHQWPPLAEKHGCGPCVVNLCDVRGMVPTTGTVTVTNYLLRMLRKRKCCSSSARSDDSSGMENDDEILPSVQHSLRKKRRIFPELESEDEVISTFFDFAGEAGIEPYEGEDMDFDTLEKAAVHVREETILLDRDQAGGLGTVTMMENGTLSSRETTGTHAKTKEGESQPRKPKTVHQPVSISGGSGEKKRGRPQRVSQTPSPVNKEVIHAEASAPSRERDAPAGGSVREDPQKKSDDTDVDLPKALCLVCSITFIGLDVATDVMTHLRDCHLTKFTYNRCPYCMAVSNKLEDVEAHVEACHPDCCLAVVTHEFPQSLGSHMVPLSPTCLNQEVPAQACAPGPSEGKGLDKDWYKDTIDKCLICQETLEEDNTLPAVRNHMKDVHLLTSMYKCGHCLAVSDSPQNIAWHSKICHQNIWVINHGILNHVEQEQPPPMAKDVSLAKPSLQGELNTCLLCKEKFDDEDIQKMAEHMVRRHKNTMVKCGHCNCISGSKADIINHCKNCHGTIKLAVYPHSESQSLERAGRRAGTHGASSSQQRQEGKMSRERSTPPEQDKKADCWRFICTKCGMCYTDRNIFSDHTQSCFNVEPYSYVCPRAACSTVRRSFAHPEDYYRHAKDLHGSTTEPSLVKNRLEVRRLDSLVSSGENLAEQLQVPNPEGLVQSVSRIYLGLAGPDSNEEFEVPESLPAGPAATKKEKASSSVASDDTRMLSPSLSDAFTVSSSESDVVEICSVYSSPSYRPGSHLGRTWRRSDNVKFVCNQCDATMSSLPVYERHLAKHSIFHCFRKVCDWCGYVAEDIRSLVRHRKLEHPTEMYSCERCSYKCPNPRDMKEHYKRTHNEFHWGPLGRKAINMQPSVLLLNFLSIPPHHLGHFMSANDVGAIDCMGSGLALPSQEPFCEDEEILQLLKEEGAEEKNV